MILQKTYKIDLTKDLQLRIVIFQLIHFNKMQLLLEKISIIIYSINKPYVININN